MRIETLDLSLASAGTQRTLTVYRFGEPGARPKLYVQASLHADEIPGMLVAVHLCNRLEALETEGKIRGEIIVVPVANPIGLSQAIQGTPFGRFALADGTNFNRHFADVVPGVAASLLGRLTNDGASNVALIRRALVERVAQLDVSDEVSALRRALLSLAVDADVVLDLHCDSEAVSHLYTATHLSERARPLAGVLNAEALLTADVSGDHPFDEALSRPWVEIARMFPEVPIPHACFSATIELRGDADVSHALARTDAQAIIDFSVIEGVIDGAMPSLPTLRANATPLAGVLPLVVATPGVIVFERAPGDRVAAGDVIAYLVDPTTREQAAIRTTVSGVLFARCRTRYAVAGQRIAKIAGEMAIRSGKLLSP